MKKKLIAFAAVMLLANSSAIFADEPAPGNTVELKESAQEKKSSTFGFLSPRNWYEACKNNKIKTGISATVVLALAAAYYAYQNQDEDSQYKVVTF